MLRNVLVTLIKGISSFLAVLALSCGLCTALSVLLIVLSLISAVLNLIGFGWWADLETALYGLFALLIFATGAAVSYKISGWSDALAERIEFRG